jgi:hypothetical protein
MARFRGTIQGQRGQASRLGSAKSGLTVNVNGWNVGIQVFAEDSDWQDRFEVYLTGGSNRASNPVRIGIFTAADLKGVANG